MRILVTGTAGFIGFSLASRLLKLGHQILGIDNLNPYYDVKLKKDRHALLKSSSDFVEVIAGLETRSEIEAAFASFRPEIVVSLAAQAGVRYSLENPRAYIDSNIVGFLNILEACRHHSVRHLVYASSSSVYGANQRLPFAETDLVGHPVSLYAASKRSNELMAHAYSHLFRLPSTGLRFFTVYGPWGRPDMALFLFAERILAGRPLDVFNRGDMERSFTYIDDIVDGILPLLELIPEPDPGYDSANPNPSRSPTAPFRVFNIGHDQAVPLLRYIELLEKELGRTADRKLLPMQPGDIRATRASVDALKEATGYRPTTPVEVGIAEFVRWYRGYYGVG